MNFKFFQFIFFFFFCQQIAAQELLPFVENFTKHEYSGDNQVWNVVQGNDNAIYFANNHYFIRYNGVKWERYTLPNKTIIRSIYSDGDRIYCGSYKEFGFWQRKNGLMQYQSLTENNELLKNSADNEEIWKIFKSKDKLYFQTFNELFILNSNQKLEKIKFPHQISYCYVIDEKIYVATVKQGVYVFENKTFTKKENWKVLENNVIHNMEKFNGKLHIFTKHNGIFIEENNNLVAWNHPLNAVFKEKVIITAKIIGNDKMAVGTSLQGLFLVDLKTGKHQNLNRQNTLKNNCILAIATDKEGDLWLGLDNGISHVEINSPVEIFTDNSGILGSVYALATLQNGYLFVTNHGIFTCENKNLEVIPNSQGQVWDIFKKDNNFIIGHNDGTFFYDGILKRVNPVNGGWKLLEGKFEKVYFQGNYSGIVVYENTNDLSQYKSLAKITKPIRNLAQNKPRELWAADSYRSLYRIIYNKNFEVEKVENVSQSNGITNDFAVKLFSYKNEILFLIDNNWYTYNSISGKLVKNDAFNKDFKNVTEVIEIDQDNFMVLRDDMLYTVHQKDNNFVWNLIPEKYYRGRIILENIKVFKDQNQFFINLDDGFFTIKSQKSKTPNQKFFAEGYFQGKLISEGDKIAKGQPVEINIVTEFLGFNRPEIFYRLDQEEKFVPVKEGAVILNNLLSGSHTANFYVNNGTTFTKIASYQFDVRWPWYYSFWMILVYILVIAGALFLYYRWNKIRYLEKLKLREEELKHHQEILELELKAENNRKLQEYEKHILEIEVQNKAYEVAGKSLSIAKQSEMIDSIQQILESENESRKIKEKIRKSIKVNALNKNEWESFQQNLMQSNEEFVQKLTTQFPNLTSKDIKLCIYLKMNLSSKEIAPLMNITFRGVELHRYRLRKKLNLSQDESLNNFMMKI